MVYELLYLTPLLERDEERTALRERVSKTIEHVGGSITSARDFARQRLAYPVKRHDSGEYILIEFSAPPVAIASVERELRLMSEILRLMVTVKNERVRAVGAEVEAMERTKAQQVAAKEAATKAAAARERASSEPPEPIEDLDERLEEILGKEMV